MVSSSTSADSRSHRFGLRSLISTMVLIPLLLTGMAAGTVFASDSDVNGGGGRYTDPVDNGSLGNLQPTSLPSPSPLTTSSVSPSPAQSQSESTPSHSHEDAKTQSATADSHTVVFDPANGSKAERVTVPDGSLASPPIRNPQRDGYRFDGWAEHDGIMDFRTPITRDITLKAKWTAVTDWTLSPDHGPASGGTSITITPPSADSPSFSALEAHDDRVIGVTGDGRLFTWTSNAKMPAQVPSPQGESGDVRFIRGVVGENGYAALSRAHRIYAWRKSGDTPALLNADSTTYTSIAMTNDRLMAVDQEGHIHTWVSQVESNSQKLFWKSAVKTISLPRQALAVEAIGNADHLLALDRQGNVWICKPTATNTDQIQPIKLANRVTQISAMVHGFVLLNSSGQISYLDNGQTQPELLVLPDSSAATTISSDATQATVVNSKGHLWTWQPRETPVRADRGNQRYLQAVTSENWITAVDWQGKMSKWNLDEQGQSSKPVRINTTTIPTVESANLDSEPLKPTKTGDAWQVQTSAHKPGPAAITLAGRQDGQPFTRSLDYTVDQPLLRNARKVSTYQVTFETDGGSTKPGDQSVSYPYGRVKRPSPDPVRDGYQFDGWFIGEVAYNFSKPVTENLTLTAKWTPNKQNNTWSINPDKGSQLGGQQTVITPPDSSSGIKFNQVSASATYGRFSLAVGSDGNAYAWGDNMYGELGDGTEISRTTPVKVKKPIGAPTDFTYVQVSAGEDHSMALGSDGYVYAWGDGAFGQLGNNEKGYENRSSIPVRMHDGNNSSKGLAAVQVSAGPAFSLAVDKNGNIWACGQNPYGQLGKGSTYNSWYPTRVLFPSNTTSAVQVSAGDRHSLAVDTNGNAWAWGQNSDGQLGNGTTTDWHENPNPILVKFPKNTGTVKVSQVSAGLTTSLAIDSNGNAWAWGSNEYGQLGNGTKGGYSDLPVQIQDPNDVSKVLNVVQISGGTNYSLAIDNDGNAWAWGNNEDGQLGDNTTNDRLSPVKVLDSTQSETSAGPWLNAAQVSAGEGHALAIDADGNAKAWGEGYGVLGNPDAGNQSLAPVPVMFPSQPVITAVSFDTSPATDLTPVSNSNSVTVVTPAHEPGQVKVSVDYKLGDIAQKPYTSLTYTYTPYTPAGVLPSAGGEGFLLALAAGTTSMGGVLASRRHRREQHLLLYASHE